MSIYKKTSVIVETNFTSILAKKKMTNGHVISQRLYKLHTEEPIDG